MKHRFVNALFTLLAAAAILLAILAMWTVLTTEKGEAPQIAGISLLRVVSGSMEPEMPEGSVVFVKKTAAAELTVGDAISFYSRDPAIGGEINTHRIVEVGEENGRPYFITKGDANSIKDPYAVYPEDILGRVVYCSRLFGWFVNVAASAYGYIFLVVIPILAIFIVNVREIVRLFRKAVAEEMQIEGKKDDKDEKTE